LLLSAVEEAAQQRDEDILKEPLEHAPEHELVLVGEVAGILIFSAELKPGDLVNVEAVQNRDPGKHLKPIELHELVNLLVEYFFVFTLHEPGRHHLRHEFRQKIRNIPILCISLKKLLKDISALLSACLRIHEHLLLTLSPIIEQGTIFSQVIIVVESALLLDHVVEHLFALLAHRLAHSIESKDLLHDFVPDLRVCLIFRVQYVFLKERVLPVHMRAIKQSVSIYDFFPKTLTDILRVVIALILEVVLVAGDIFSLVHFSNTSGTLCSDRLLVAP
jgi:hypothetical protein